jgi:hypothetical protein
VIITDVDILFELNYFFVSDSYSRGSEEGITDPIALAKRRIDVAFELFTKLGVGLFHEHVSYTSLICAETIDLELPVPLFFVTRGRRLFPQCNFLRAFRRLERCHEVMIELLGLLFPVRNLVASFSTTCVDLLAFFNATSRSRDLSRSSLWAVVAVRHEDVDLAGRRGENT